MGVYSFLKTGNVMNEEFCFEKLIDDLDPIDYQSYQESPVDFYAVVTNVLTGEPEYMKYTTADRNNLILKATCALPILFPNIYINDTPYLDGGLSDSIPYEKAFEDGCDRVVVVLTREPGYKKSTTSSTKAMARAYHRYPNIAIDLVKRAGRYNHSLKKLRRLEKEGKVIVIRPDSTEGFSRLERDKEKILNMYDEGYAKGIDISGKVAEFFAK